MTHFASRFAAAFVSIVAVVATGCATGGDVSSENTDHQEAALGVAQGVDYSWGRPSPQGLVDAGYTFAARYLSNGGGGKNISKDEADALTAAGVSVVLVFEQEADAVLGGYARGVSDAQFAAGAAADVGQPGDRPIYFAVDFDAQPSQEGTIDAYFDGVADTIGRGRTGAYGGYYLINRLFNDGKITWGWQAYAWSYGNWDGRAQVRQTDNGQTVAGADVDLDVAMVSDFGQWGGSGGGGDCNAACGNYGCQCVAGQCNGGFCPGTGCSAQETADCGNYGANCVDHQCNGGFADGSGCTALETIDCGNYGAGCVDHKCNGGYAEGTGCTARETLDCGNYGVNCVDHKCDGGFGPGTGCTPRETLDCGNYGANCVDHKCSGGFGTGTGCTAHETLDCGNYGCDCVDHACSGGFCPGTGCTARETLDCGDYGCGCRDHKCSGGACGN